MTLFELLTSPWAILPDSLREMQLIYAAHQKSESADIAGIEARLGRPLVNEAQPYVVHEGGIAVLGIDGPIAPKANLFTQVSGGASAQLLTRQVEGALADTRVKGLVLAIDSPGGSVFGTPELAAAVRRAADVKPVAAVSEATITSAAYWVGSAANAVYLSGPTVEAGSIGVYARMQLSAPDPGTLEFTRGKYKRGGLNGAPPSAEYMADFEGKLNYLYSVFVETVAAHRGVSVQQVLDRMADGRVFIGQQAIDAGLADGFATVADVVEQMAANLGKFSSRRKAVFAMRPIASTPARAVSKGPHQMQLRGRQQTQATTAIATTAGVVSAINRAYARHGAQFTIRVQALEAWEAEAAASMVKEGGDLLAAMYRVGFVHSHVSLPPIAARR